VHEATNQTDISHNALRLSIVQDLSPKVQMLVGLRCCEQSTSPLNSADHWWCGRSGDVNTVLVIIILLDNTQINPCWYSELKWDLCLALRHRWFQIDHDQTAQTESATVIGSSTGPETPAGQSFHSDLGRTYLTNAHDQLLLQLSKSLHNSQARLHHHWQWHPSQKNTFVIRCPFTKYYAVS